MIRWSNQAFASAVGQPRHSLVDRLPGEALPRWSQLAGHCARALETGEAWHNPSTPDLFAASESGGRWQISITPLYDGEGGRHGCLIVHADAEQGHAAVLEQTLEEARRQNDLLRYQVGCLQARVRELEAGQEGERKSRPTGGERHLRAVIDQMPEGVIVADGKGRVTQANQAAEGIFSRLTPTEDAPSGASTFDPRELLPIRSLLDGETHVNVELVIHSPEGPARTILANSAPVRDEEGTIMGAVAVFQDVSTFKELDQLKDEFLSIAAHELKTPMTSLKGFAQLLLRRRVLHRAALVGPAT